MLRVALFVLVSVCLVAPFASSPSAAGGAAHSVFYVATGVYSGLVEAPLRDVPALVGRDYVALVGICPPVPSDLALAEVFTDGDSWDMMPRDDHGANGQGIACFYRNNDFAADAQLNDREWTVVRGIPADRIQFWIGALSLNGGVATIGIIDVHERN